MTKLQPTPKQPATIHTISEAYENSVTNTTKEATKTNNKEARSAADRSNNCMTSVQQYAGLVEGQ